jgi:hypothetical protein
MANKQMIDDKTVKELHNRYYKPKIKDSIDLGDQWLTDEEKTKKVNQAARRYRNTTFK